MLQDVIESAYFAFRRRLRDIKQSTSCAFRRLAFGGRQPRPGHTKRQRAKGSQKTSLPMAVTRARCARWRRPANFATPLVSISPQGAVEFGLQKLFDETTNARANPCFQGIEPIVAKTMFVLAGVHRRLCAIACHGVISISALTPILFAFTNRRLRHLQIPTTPATAPRRVRHSCISRIPPRLRMGSAPPRWTAPCFTS